MSKCYFEARECINNVEIMYKGHRVYRLEIYITSQGIAQAVTKRESLPSCELFVGVSSEKKLN
jgi:hypothetical protein